MSNFIRALLNLRITVVVPLLVGFCLLAIARWRPGLGSKWFKTIESRLSTLARRRILSTVLLGLAPVALRLALLPIYGPPIPAIHDEFGHLLVADTLLHGRFANPPNTFHEFFESLYIIQSPTYSSYYPIGIGVSLVIGRVLFGHPWGGVLLFDGLMCALVYWMLLAWVTPGWAFLGSTLLIFNMGVLSLWANSYWGGAAAAVAGCLIFGAIPRLIDEPQGRNGLVLGIGLSYLALIRPFETALLGPCLLALAFLYRNVIFAKSFQHKLALLALGLAPGICITLLHNRAVTGNWTKLPYELSREQYGVPQTFNFQAPAIPHQALTRTQQAMYDWQTKTRRSVTTLSGWLEELPGRLDTIHIFLGGAVTPVLIFLPFSLYGRRLWWMLGTVIFTFLGGSTYGFFNPPYVAHLAGLFLLLGIVCMMRMNQLPWGRTAVRLMIAFAVCYFAVLYTFYAAREALPASVRQNHLVVRELAPLTRTTKRSQLADYIRKIGVRHLVFVNYLPGHDMQHEWVFNAADIDASRIVWALDLGGLKDKQLMLHYPDRAVWRVDVGNEKTPVRILTGSPLKPVRDNPLP